MIDPTTYTCSKCLSTRACGILNCIRKHPLYDNKIEIACKDVPKNSKEAIRIVIKRFQEKQPPKVRRKQINGERFRLWLLFRHRIDIYAVGFTIPKEFFIRPPKKLKQPDKPKKRLPPAIKEQEKKPDPEPVLYKFWTNEQIAKYLEEIKPRFSFMIEDNLKQNT